MLHCLNAGGGRGGLSYCFVLDLLCWWGEGHVLMWGVMRMNGADHTSQPVFKPTVWSGGQKFSRLVHLLCVCFLASFRFCGRTGVHGVHRFKKNQTLESDWRLAVDCCKFWVPQSEFAKSVSIFDHNSISSCFSFINSTSCDIQSISGIRGLLFLSSW